MRYATILVHFGYDTQSSTRLDVGVALARTYEAHLVGLYAVPRLDLPSVVRAYANTEMLEEQKRGAKTEAAKAEAAFRERAEREGLSYEWRFEMADVAPLVALHARYADIAVIGQAPPPSEGYDYPGLPEQVVLSAGRPAIVVPYVGSYPVLGKEVLVAWNGTREAARAVADALPLLVKAERVTVLSIDPPDEHHIAGADIASSLARHGVHAEASRTSGGDLDVGDVLLSRAADLGADLAVMGAYGHSRAREWALGGVTRHLLRHMTLPVLMSH